MDAARGLEYLCNLLLFRSRSEGKPGPGEGTHLNLALASRVPIISVRVELGIEGATKLTGSLKKFNL